MGAIYSDVGVFISVVDATRGKKRLTYNEGNVRSAEFQ